jgi:TPP-dependent pyruvate/acetoin dehydrogenase alpha subunit
MRGEDRVGLVYVGDGATSTGPFHEGINFAAVQRCPLVVVVENNGYAYSTPTSKQTAATRFVDKAIGYGIPANGQTATTSSPSTMSRAGPSIAPVAVKAYRWSS